MSAYSKNVDKDNDERENLCLKKKSYIMLYNKLIITIQNNLVQINKKSISESAEKNYTYYIRITLFYIIVHTKSIVKYNTIIKQRLKN